VKEVILTPEGYKKLQQEIEYLSNESPVGKAIIGRKKGETVEVTAPRGSMKYKILEIKAA
jgi:transcription elongation factor GreA